MSWIIRVEQLSKLYRIGSRITNSDTLYERMVKRGKKLLGRVASDDLLSEQALSRSAEHMISHGQGDEAPKGHFWALKDVSFEVRPGERIGIIGQNGSGKSTLLKILSRITAPTEGEFRFRGHLISLLEVGTGFHADLSGRENIYLNAAINGMTRKQIEARFNDIVEFSELGEHIETPVKRYSSGMYMRLAFAVAAHLESEILLIDEVLAVGDSGFQKKCKEKMLEVANDGRTLLFVSHDMDTVNYICNKTIELSHGRIKSINTITNQQHNKASEQQQNADPSSSLSYQSWHQQLEHIGLQGYFSVQSLCLLNANQQQQNQFTTDQAVIAQVCYRIEKPMCLAVQCYIKNSSGQGLLVANQQAQLKTEQRKPVGSYTDSVLIPGHMLGEGQYFVSLYLFSPDLPEGNSELADMLSFKLTASTSKARQQPAHWSQQALQVELAWDSNFQSVNQLEESSSE